MANAVEASLLAACKTGALVRYKVSLETGELENRRLWLRPELAALHKRLDPRQSAVLSAALRRFVVGGEFTVVTALSEHHREVRDLGDIRELKGPPPPFMELRFKPPKHDLRLFGRFIGGNALVLTTYGMKSPDQKTGQRRLSIPAEVDRCNAVFRGLGLPVECVPQSIRDSISPARFI